MGVFKNVEERKQRIIRLLRFWAVSCENWDALPGTDGDMTHMPYMATELDRFVELITPLDPDHLVFHLLNIHFNHYDSTQDIGPVADLIFGQVLRNPDILNDESLIN